MRTWRDLVVLAALLILGTVMLHAQQYSLEVIQQFNENSAGKSNQVKCADVDGDGLKDMVAVYSAPGNVGQVIGIWLWRGTKFSDSVDCTINIGFKKKACWFNAGDVNNDGKADIVAMSQYGGDDPPRVVYGRTPWPRNVTSPDVSCQFPVDPDWQSGPQYTSVTIGDFNGDGINDFAYPDQGTKISTGNYGGRMVMYFGGATISGVPDLVFNYPGNDWGFSPTPPDTFHVFLRWFSPFIAKGDFNGDGNEDVFTSGYYSYCTQQLVSLVTGRLVRMDNTGAGVVFFGGADLDTIPDVILLPPDDFIQYSTTLDFMYAGYWVFNAGDISGDGADELSLPSWYWAINFVYKGIKGMPQVPSEFQTLIVRDPMFYFTKNRYNSLGYADQNGASLVPIGDINGDGIPDLGNSRNYYGLGPDNPGVRLFFCQTNMVGAIDTSFVTEEYSQIQESNMDFDGDGRVDLVMNDLDSKLTLVKLAIATGVKDEWMKNTPREFVLAQNYPNPFNPTTRIAYYLPRQTHVTLAVYDMLGRLMETLVNEEQGQGPQEVAFDAENYASGNYLYRLNAGGVTQTKIMTIVR